MLDSQHLESGVLSQAMEDEKSNPGKSEDDQHVAAAATLAAATLTGSLTTSGGGVTLKKESSTGSRPVSQDDSDGSNSLVNLSQQTLDLSQLETYADGQPDSRDAGEDDDNDDDLRCDEQLLDNNGGNALARIRITATMHAGVALEHCRVGLPAAASVMNRP